MNELTEDILAFLTKHRVCALATMLPDGMPHGAALHYSHKNSPFELYVSVDSTNRKCIGLLKGEPVNGTVVIGFSEEEWLTLQMDGTVVAVSDQLELANIQKRHYVKHPNSEKYKDESTTVFLKFTPIWWRYTDFNTTPITTVSSIV